MLGVDIGPLYLAHVFFGWSTTRFNDWPPTSFKGNMVQIKVAQTLASCACALALAIPLLPGVAQAQSASAPVTQVAPSAAAPALPVITDVKPVDASGAAKKAAEVTDNPYGLEAVSYTHLTLPTNREV